MAERLNPVAITLRNSLLHPGCAGVADSESLRSRGVLPERAARFLMRLVFCLFAERYRVPLLGLSAVSVLPDAKVAKERRSRIIESAATAAHRPQCICRG
jgi:hypothetical protein